MGVCADTFNNYLFAIGRILILDGKAMMMELVFSFLINTWKDLPEVGLWAQENIGGVETLITKMREEDQILCALEKNRLLSFDGQWKKRDQTKSP